MFTVWKVGVDEVKENYSAKVPSGIFLLKNWVLIS
jgi:hypothetical protein